MGINHQDLKPGNISILDGNLHLIDFDAIEKIGAKSCGTMTREYV